MKPTLTESGSDPWSRLRAWGGAEQLLERFPELPPLLGGLDDDQSYRLGRKLLQLDAGKLLARHPTVEMASVFVASNFTCSGVVAFLTTEAARHGLLLKCEMGGFNEYLFELGDPTSRLYESRPELALCLLDAHVVFDAIEGSITPGSIHTTLEYTFAQLARLAEEFLARGPGTLVLNTLPLPRFYAAQILSYKSRMLIAAAWRDFNARLLRLGAGRDRLIVLDIDVYLTASGPLGDAAAGLYAKAHFGDHVLASYAREVVHVLRAQTARTKKCLVLDLDGTLWGGVLGDAGKDGIEMGEVGEGPAFGRFQRVIRGLASQGVVLAILSKNDDDKVLDVLRTHPQMGLRETDFAAICANWDPKHGNLAKIAAELNIGTDSIVFADDSSFECGLIRKAMPEVTVLELGADPVTHTDRLLRDDWFAALTLTDEDAGRGAMYQAEAHRRALQQNASSLEEYLRELHVEVSLSVPRRVDIARISQLTQRTNQFNLTTWRMDVGEVERFLDDPAALLLAIRAADRYGDNGLVGALFIRLHAEHWSIENMLLSCRVFSRGIETSCLAILLAAAKRAGMGRVSGLYRASSKNHRFADFYLRHGFAAVNGGGSGAAAEEFAHRLDPLPVPISYIGVTADFARPSL